MGENGSRIPKVDMSNSSVYDNEDLNYLKNILTDIMEDCPSLGRSLSINDREYLRERLAAAIFQAAEAGERDYSRLKRRAIEAVSPVPFSRSGP